MQTQKVTAEQAARIFGAPIENIRAQYAKNANQLSAMAAEVEAFGKPINGLTGAELAVAAQYAKEQSLTPMEMHITCSAYGKVPVITVHTLNQASAAYRSFCQHNDLGGSTCGHCYLKIGGKVVARVSYNGRVWEGSDLDCDMSKLMYQP